MWFWFMEYWFCVINLTGNVGVILCMNVFLCGCFCFAFVDLDKLTAADQSRPVSPCLSDVTTSSCQSRPMTPASSRDVIRPGPIRTLHPATGLPVHRTPSVSSLCKWIHKNLRWILQELLSSPIDAKSSLDPTNYTYFRSYFAYKYYNYVGLLTPKMLFGPLRRRIQLPCTMHSLQLSIIWRMVSWYPKF